MMMLDRYTRRSWQIGVALIAAVLLAGCTAVNTGGDKGLPLPSAPAIENPGPTASITMEIRRAGSKKPEIAQVQLDSGATVQRALEKSNLVKRFRRMNIEVVRVVGEQRAKLDVKYDHTRAQVNPLYDYALHPGDHVIVAEDPSTAFDDMFKSLSGPLRGATGSRPNHRLAM